MVAPSIGQTSLIVFVFCYILWWSLLLLIRREETYNSWTEISNKKEKIKKFHRTRGLWKFYAFLSRCKFSTFNYLCWAFFFFDTEDESNFLWNSQLHMMILNIHASTVTDIFFFNEYCYRVYMNYISCYIQKVGSTFT